jgi:protein gp37
MQPRFGMPAFETQRRLNVKPYLHEPALQEVLTRRKPTRYFWCDMSDLFGAWVPDDWIDRCFGVMALTPWHTHLVLTKRAERMRAYVASRATSGRLPIEIAREVHKQSAALVACETYLTAPGRAGFIQWPLPNVWLGVSGENQRSVDERLIALCEIPAAVRFISLEPLLEEVYLRGCWKPHGLDWVIVGGESGPKARPFDLAWARSIVQQCQATGVPVFVKQIGARPFTADLTHCRGSAALVTDRSGYVLSLRDKKGGDPSEWPPDLRVREYPQTERA